VQEFILAEQVTFLCGSSSAEFEAVRDAVHLIQTNIDRLKLFAGKIQRLYQTMEDEEKANTAFHRVLNARERHPRQMGKEKLQRLLIEFKESECYDRDRIYALLSLAEGGDGFLVDYEEDTKALSRRALGCEAFWVKKGVGKSLLQWALFGNERDTIALSKIQKHLGDYEHWTAGHQLSSVLLFLFKDKS
jgi:hypothetical protein